MFFKAKLSIKFKCKKNLLPLNLRLWQFLRTISVFVRLKDFQQRSQSLLPFLKLWSFLLPCFLCLWTVFLLTENKFYIRISIVGILSRWLSYVKNNIRRYTLQKYRRCSSTVMFSNRMSCWGQRPILWRTLSISVMMSYPFTFAVPLDGARKPDSRKEEKTVI